jgi:hypothetical protein
VFDPRYRDFPFAALTMSVLPFLLLTAINRRAEGSRSLAELAFAGVLVISALYTGFNDWTCGIYLLFALTLSRARVVQIPE